MSSPKGTHGTCWGGAQPGHPGELPHHLLWQLGGGTGWTHLWFSPMSSATSYTGDGRLLAPWSPEWGVGDKDGSPPPHGGPGTLGMMPADTDASEECLRWDWSSLRSCTLSWPVHPCWETHGEGSGTCPRLGRGPLPSSSSAPMQCHGAAARPAPSSGWVPLLLATLPARRREGDRKDRLTKRVRVPGSTPGQHLMAWHLGACCQDARTPPSPVQSGCAGPPVPTPIPILGFLQPPGTEKSERGARWPLRSELGWLWTRFWAGAGAAGLEQAGRCAGVPRPSRCQAAAA